METRQNDQENDEDSGGDSLSQRKPQAIGNKIWRTNGQRQGDVERVQWKQR